MSKLIAKNKSKKLGLFKFRKSTTDLSEWNKNDEKLLKAIEVGDVDKVQSLLQKKTLVPTKLGPRGLSVFHVACASGQIKIVDQLLQYGAEPNVLTIQGCTALQLAASNGWPQVVHKLVQIGAVVDHKDGNNLTALHHACMDAKYECVQVLLRSGADINIKDKTGKTCLFYAAHCGDFKICKELLDKGADVNTFDNHKVTPLMAAAKKGRTDVCEWLLKKGADRNFTDVQGRKALDYAMDEGHNEIKRIFEKAPTRASWDLQNDIGKPKPMQGAEGGYNVVAEEMVHPDQADVVEFVQEPSPKLSPKLEHRNVVEEESSPRTLSVASSSTHSSSEQQQQQLQQQRAMEAYKVQHDCTVPLGLWGGSQNISQSVLCKVKF